MSLQEKGFVISIQHLQSHRGILGHARILFSCPKGYKTQSCHWWGIVNRKHLGLFLNLANSSTGIYQTKGSDMGMGQNWTPCQWRGQWWPKTYQHSYFVACQRPPLQFAPNWPDPGHGTAQEAHLHSQALQFPDLTMNSSFFFLIRVIQSEWGESSHSSDSKWEILHCHVWGVHQIYAQRTYSHTPSERGLRLAIPGVPHPSCGAPKPQGPCSGRHGGRWNLSVGTSWWLGIQVPSIIIFHKPIPLRFPAGGLVSTILRMQIPKAAD